MIMNNDPFKIEATPEIAVEAGHPELGVIPRQEYKTAEEKQAYEQQISTRIRPYLFLHSEDLANEISEAVELDPAEYAERFSGAWSEHVVASQNISNFLTARMHSQYPQWSPSEWLRVRALLVDAFDTDREKNIYSAGVKTRIESATQELTARYGWTEDEVQTCITPSRSSFHTQYNLDHMRLALTGDVAQSAALRRELAEQYHHGDEGLLELRYDKMGLDAMPKQALSIVVSQTQTKIEQQAVKKQKFLERYPDARAVDDLLVFDNWQEYLYVYAQAGYPDLHLREEVIKQATQLGMAVPNDEALAYKQAELLGMTDDARAIVEQRYSLPVVNYAQTVTSCGVSTVMSFASRDLPHNRETELALWQRAGAPYNFPGGIGLILRKLGYEVTLETDRDRHFIEGQYPVQDIEYNQATRGTAEEYVRLHNAAVSAGMLVAIKEISFDCIVYNLEDGKASIIGIHMPYAPSILHWILAHGYNRQGTETTLDIADPMEEITTLNARRFETLVDTYMGRRIITVDKNKVAASL